MAADEERAQRIRNLKDERPDLTWRLISEHVGVSERAAVEWAKTGGINYDNCKLLAGLFEVDVDWLWRGETGATPDPFARGGHGGNGGQIEAALSAQAEMSEALQAQLLAFQAQTVEMLSAQASTLDSLMAQLLSMLSAQDEVLEGIRNRLAALGTVVGEIRELAAEQAQRQRPAKAPPARRRKAS